MWHAEERTSNAAQEPFAELGCFVLATGAETKQLRFVLAWELTYPVGFLWARVRTQ